MSMNLLLGFAQMRLHFLSQLRQNPFTSLVPQLFLRKIGGATVYDGTQEFIDGLQLQTILQLLVKNIVTE